MMPKSVAKLISYAPDVKVRDCSLPVAFDDAVQDKAEPLDKDGIDFFRKRLGEFLRICKIHPELS